MVIDPVIVTAAIGLLGGMGTLLVAMYRAFMSGALHPRATVPRESFEKAVAITESYERKFDEQIEAIRTLAQTQQQLDAKVTALVAKIDSNSVVPGNDRG